MTPVVDIIGYVVAAMKPSLLNVETNINGTTVTVTNLSNTRRLFVGEKVKVTDTSNNVYYCPILTISSHGFTMGPYTGGSIADSLQVVINYHYGHPLEITNMIRQKVQNENYNREVFPMVCLFQDFKETFKEAHEWEAELNVVIVTDTRPEYEASQRYTYSFTPMLYPLYELFLKELAGSNYIQNTHFDHVKYDRLYWGKSGIYGNVANIFNDFIDAIELENLRVKILKSC